MKTQLLVGGGVVAFVVLLGLWAVVRIRRRSGGDVDASRVAHEAAKERPPPVEKGDVVELVVEELDRHHSGRVDAVGRIEGFVVFVRDVPDSVAEGTLLEAQISSFNRGGTSASAMYRKAR